MPDWFEQLFGFQETSDAVYANLTVDGDTLTSSANGRSWRIGMLETPTLAELRDRVDTDRGTPIHVRNIVGEAGILHRDPANAHALIQAASQFNLLEMVSPEITPEEGIRGYAGDHTQGPTCAMAAAAGTVYRNYFVPIDGQLGQTANRQIDCLRDVQDLLAPDGRPFFEMRNGYAMPAGGSLEAFDETFASLRQEQLDDLRSRLRIGLHWDVETTHPNAGHLVSQAYCSALPLAYWRTGSAQANRFAALILDALYEATLLAAIENADSYPGAPVFLTSVGGGVFGNDERRIVDAMERAFKVCAESGLDVRIVNFGRINERFRPLERG